MTKPEKSISTTAGFALTVTLILLILIPVTVFSVLNLRATTPQALTCFDFNGDGVVDSDDMDIFLSHFPSYLGGVNDHKYDPKFDFNSDGDVDYKDRDEMLTHLGETCPPTASFSANKTRIVAGSKTTLKWSTKRTSSVSISNIGKVAKSGSKQVKPSSTKTYTLTAKGPGGTKKQSVKITVVPPSPETNIPSSTVSSTPSTGFTQPKKGVKYISTITIKLNALTELSGDLPIRVSVDGVEFSREVVISSTTKEIRVSIPSKTLRQGKTYTLRITSDKLLTKRVRFKTNSSKVTVKAGTLFLGDMNGSNNINVEDVDLLTNEFFEGGAGDLNLDGFVNSLDYSILIKNLGKKGD